ncbi:DNA polymerase III [Candidatus Nasuia deltocephalinicola]|uniref:DNA polymerase III n=1 Tax=Candidatus Nasuia deltocephalincola TaxID=1160784 RepID=A0A7G6UHW2_9PROT|nr:DNA polymerase III [Candidatus Nasuia deltocephalinicola]
MTNKIIIKKNFLLNILKILNIIYSKKNNKLIILIKKKIYFIYKDKNIQINFFIKSFNKKINIILKINFIFFFNIIKNLNNNIINLYIKNNRIEIKNNKIKYNIKIIKNFKKKIWNKKKKLIKFKINILKYLISDFLNYINIISKNKKNNKNIYIVINNNSIKFIILDNYQIIYYRILKKFIFIKNKKSIKIKIKNSLFLILKILILERRIKKKFLKFIICKKYIYFKIKEKLVIISKLKNINFLTINILKKKYKNYVLLKTDILKNIISKMFTNKQNIEINIRKNCMIFSNSLEDNQKIINKIKINYLNDCMKFIIDKNDIMNFLKITKSKNIIFNFSRKKNLVITLPNLKGFKYIISIVKI